ncbi:MAG: hypothetical protein UY50_C0006G0010 [Parcubacteria group bacterium GW2011_GWA2_49_9]|nr:MAG: hypothetical protein UY50_C0006G0010 [Parcubacteria group bacterium GW2011_GWA2_49_9]
MFCKVLTTMQKIFLGKKLVAIKASLKSVRDGTHPLSLPDDALQIMTMKRPKSYVAKAHRHIPKRRITELLQECLIVVKGKVRFDLFDSREKLFKKVLVREGEAMLILEVAHEVRYLEDTLAYELKNGPFIDDKQFL